MGSSCAGVLFNYTRNSPGSLFAAQGFYRQGVLGRDLSSQRQGNRWDLKYSEMYSEPLEQLGELGANHPRRWKPSYNLSQPSAHVDSHRWIKTTSVLW